MSVPDQEPSSGGDDTRIADPTPMEVDPPASTLQPDTNGTATTVQPITSDKPLTNEAPQADESNLPPPPPPPPSQPRICGVCNENPGKYKCARCGLPFCSVSCSKYHRENHPPDPEPASPAPAPSAAPEAPNQADAANPFRTLGESEQLRYLFRRFPDLGAQLLAINAETEPPSGEAPPTTFSQVMMARAAAASGKQKKEQWNHDVGIRKGKEALRAARRIEGDIGEGVREYTELVLHFAAQQEAAVGRNAVVDGSSAKQDAELIKRLLEEDTR